MSAKSKTAEVIKPLERPALILVHGFRGAPAGLDGIAMDLQAAGYEVHVPAIPPFAGAPTLPEYTPESYADYIAKYIREHNLKRPILIGHSMGSLIVAATANKYRSLLHPKLVLMAPISSRTPKVFSLVAPLQNLVPRKMVDYITTRYLFVPHDRKLFKQVMKITDKCSGNHPPKCSEASKATKFSTGNSIADFSLTDQVLFLTGKKDRVVSIKKTAKLAQTVGAETVFLEESGHLHNYEKPHETAQAIIDFITRE